MGRKKTKDAKPASKPKKAAAAKTPVESVKHTKQTRSNIPTREQGSMVAGDETAPKKLLYPRDTSLDPQLVWKGKDEQDAEGLTVPVVPIYIQEKVHSQALIEDLRSRAAAGAPADFPLFGDFNGLETDAGKRTEFYRHEQHWTNRFILGDSLYVMASLAEKERLKGQVQCIYFDPPYGIKFGSNWQVSTRKRDVKDSKADDLTRQPEQIKAFRDTWQLGIHSYLTYLRDRLTVARDLLAEVGSIFVQIGDENLHLVRTVMDEVFGGDNAIAVIVVRKTGGTTGKYLPGTADYVLWYGRDAERTKYKELFRIKGQEGADDSSYDLVELSDGSRRRLTPEERKADKSTLPGKRFQLTILTSPRIREARTGNYPIKFQGVEYWPTAGEWKTHKDGIARLLAARRIDRVGSTLRYVRYLDDFPATAITSLWTDVGGASEPVYVVQTNARIIERCVLMSTDPGDLVLDPTCGSGTAAYVAEQWGRRWITIDTSRVALALARTRMMTARFPYYLLGDSVAGRKKEAELTGVALRADAPPPQDDIRKGFICKRVPHVTLKSIANNPDIKEGMTRAQIDTAIAKHADTEVLVDQPYEDKGVVRVAGPFTVESLSPHRMLPAADDETPRDTGGDVGRFVTMILDHLRKTGVQNTKRGERLVFDRLDPYPGENLHAEGTYTEAGQSRRVAVSIGPEFGTVGQELLQAAAREAHRGLGFDLLLLCGFAFDPHVAEEGKVVEKQVGRMKVLCVRMNPDLAMGDELLKKTGAGNLFMVFGEPDIDLTPQSDGKLVVTIKGLDIFDPTTGEIRSSSTDDLASWFIDTDYNGESFFVRHAYFCGSGDPYEKLRRALKADIDESLWAQLNSTTSVPFPAPKTGKIAVKVINHYGDEVLRVYPVAGNKRG